MNKAKIIALLLSLQALLVAIVNNSKSKDINDLNNISISEEIVNEDNITILEENINNTVDSDLKNQIINSNVFEEEDVFLEPVYMMKLGYLKNNSKLLLNLDEESEYEEIDKFQKIIVLDSINNYYYVQTDDLKNGYMHVDDIDFLPDTFVEVDISDQTLYYYKDNDIILTSKVVTGKNSTPTYIGYFAISYKTMHTYLKGPTWKSWVDFWMPFDGGRGLHDAQWRDEFGGEIYQNNGSHGCVNMPYENAKTLYENVEKGTRVLVHK